MRWKSFCFHWWRGIGSRTLMIFKHYLCTTLISESFHCNAILINSLIISPSLYILVIFQLITWNSFSYFLLLYSFHIIYQYHKIDTSVIYEDIKAHKLCCSLLDYFHQKYELHWSLNAQMYDKNDNYSKILVLKIFDDSNIRAPKELLVRSPNKSTNWFELIHLPHNFVKKFLSVTNKSKFLSTLTVQ